MKKRGELSNDLPPELSGGKDYGLRPAGLDQTTELKLIDAAILGDTQAFSEIFEHYRPALYSLCCRRLNDLSLAEDVVQEAFLKALKKLPSFDRGKAVWPWLSTIAYRMCVDLQRHRALTQYFADLGVALDEDAEERGQTRSAFDEVMASEDRAELWKSLKALPKRQRRALLLYAQDGMSYADIAAAEGISIGAVKLLIVRARKKMRSSSQSGPLPAIVFPFTWCRWKLQRIEERIRPLLSFYGEGFSTACVQTACLGALVATVVSASFPTDSLKRDNPTQSIETVLSATQSRPLQTASLQTLPSVGATAKASVEPQQSSSDPAGSLVEDAINPNQTATPESTIVTSLAISPNYESNHTILASGSHYPGYVSLVSSDGGANWKPLPSRLLSGHTVVLSPGYPQDPRLFALGDRGLQQSDDGGEIFKTVSGSLIGWNLAIAPTFGRGDSRVLTGGKNLFEYDANTGTTLPAFLTIPLVSRSSYFSISYSPEYSSDSTVFISDASSNGQAILYRCKGSACEETQFSFPGSIPLKLRLSPQFGQNGLAYAFTNTRLFVSNDGARTFRDIEFPPLDYWAFIRDIAIAWNTFSDPTIFASPAGFPSPGLYRSFNTGRSWESIQIDVPGFDTGVNRLIVTPTGRLLASGLNYGIACSEDKGKTWAPRCTPEH